MNHVLVRLSGFLVFALLLAGCGTASDTTHTVSNWISDKPPGKGRTTPVAIKPVGAMPDMAQGVGVMAENAGAARPAKVALLLPLTGPHAAMGKSFLDAAQMAVLELGSDQFEVLPRDTGEDNGTAIAAAKDALHQGAEMMIGPVFSPMTAAVKNAAIQGNIPILTLSSDWQLAGRGTYVLGFSPAEQLNRAAAFAAQRGISRVAVLVPDTAYGALAQQTLLQNPRLQVVVKAVYHDTPESMQQAVAQLVQHRAALQAVFLPDGDASSLAHMADALAQANINAHALPLIGTSLWNNAAVMENPTLQGGWFAAPDAEAREGFGERFKEKYGYAPQSLAGLAYDATALAIVLAKQGQPYDAAHLTRANGFSGTDGVFRLTPNGVAEHGLAMMEVTAAGAEVVEPARKRF